MKAQAQTSFSVDYETEEWDLCAILGIINPDRGAFTCVGYAPSRRRRCQNPIARENRDFVYEGLELLAMMSPDSREFAYLLREVAYRSLCRRYHQNQADSVVREWEARISALRPPLTRERKAKAKEEQPERPTERPQTTGSYYRRYKKEETKPESDSQKQKEQEQREQREQQDRERRKNKQQEQEQKQKEQEQKQKEEEQKQREQEQREEEEARERRRRKAQQQREERERQAKEQAVRERREWQQAWQSYVTKWAAFKEAKHEPSDPQRAQELIPWPVKSGRCRDLQASNVKAFYRKACPHADTPAMYKTMQAESLKWHPDKIRTLYRTCTPDDADKLAIDMICRVVLELREEAKAWRAG